MSLSASLADVKEPGALDALIRGILDQLREPFEAIT